MYINEEKDILNIKVRASLLEQLVGPENITRKKEAYKRYKVYKDGTKEFVLEKIGKDMGTSATEEIKHRTPNLSFCRKIIDKKAMVYKDGVLRLTKKGDQADLDELVDLLNHNVTMKKTNRFTELFKNSVTQTVPYKDKSSGTYEIISKVLPAYNFDVVVDRQNKERALAHIVSDMKDQTELYYTGVGDERIHSKHAPVKKIVLDTTPQMFVWWSQNYHFTTNVKGEILRGDGMGDGTNLLKESIFTDFHADQDGEYWALGGNDIIDTSILINLLLADLFYIAKYQGMGLLYLTGKGVPKNIKIGPSEAVSIEVKEGEPTPTIGFATSSPPIAAHLSMIEQLLVYLLDTNGLTFAGGSVDSGASAASGIHEIVKRSDNMENIEDQQEMYMDKDPEVLRKAIKWANIFGEKKLLNDRWSKISGMKADMPISVSFKAQQPFMSEIDKLAVIEKRMELGLDTLLDAIKRDNPDMTEKEAKQKLKELLLTEAENLRKRMAEFGANDGSGTEENNENDISEGSRQSNRDDEEADE